MSLFKYIFEIKSTNSYNKVDHTKKESIKNFFFFFFLCIEVNGIKIDSFVDLIHIILSNLQQKMENNYDVLIPLMEYDLYFSFFILS